MADNEEGTESAPRGNEWEVVQLTASAYAAAPGPKGDESILEEKSGAVDDSEAETSEALFMSRHFAFPPNEHENLSIEPESIESPKGNKGGDNMQVEEHMEEAGESAQKDDDKWDIKGLELPEELPGMEQFFDEKGSTFSVHASDFEAASLHGYNIVDEQSIYGSIRGGTTIGASEYNDSAGSGVVEQPEENLDPSSDAHQPMKPGKEDLKEGSEVLPGTWWKRRMASLCAHAKETNTFWSVFIAAAVMGLVMVGQRWQRERWQVLQHRWHFSLTDEKSARMMAPLSRFKDALIGGSRRGTYIHNAASADL